jgi:hypothetical protein
MKDYSENKEQDVILNYFKNYIGNFLDIGAGDGETKSNTRALALLGWRGTFIEQYPSVFTKLEDLYHNACHPIFNIQIYPDGYHQIFNVKIADKTSEVILDDRGDKVNVETKTPGDALRSSYIVHFDFVSINCGVLEIYILKGLLKYLGKTRMICIAYNGDYDNKREILNLLPMFEVVHQNNKNLILAK